MEVENYHRASPLRPGMRGEEPGQVAPRFNAALRSWSPPVSCRIRSSVDLPGFEIRFSSTGESAQALLSRFAAAVCASFGQGAQRRSTGYLRRAVGDKAAGQIFRSSVSQGRL
jgi:hypothetical protein